jgi:hypothetical protein
MDTCYGRNIRGHSWADDDEDDFEMQAFTATAAKCEYYSSPTSTVGSDEGASDGDDNEKYSTCDEGVDEAYEERDIPPRPSTPEPTLKNDARDCDDYDIPLRPSTPEPVLPSEPCSDNVATTQASQASQAYNHPPKKLSGDPAFYLQIPYPYDIPPGLPPNTLYYLEYAGPWKPAYEELLWEQDVPTYSAAWRKIKVQRGVRGDREMLLRGSPLSQEVEFEEGKDTYHEELEADLWQDEVGMVENWELEQGEAEEIETFDVYRDEDEVEMVHEEDIVDDAQDVSEVTAVVAASFPISFVCEDELVNEAVATEEADLPSTKVDTCIATPFDEGCRASKPQKHDSVHEDYDEHYTGLSSDGESLTRSTTPESSVIVSTDDEVDVVKDSPFVLSLDEECPQQDDDVEERGDSLSSTLPTIPTTTFEEKWKEQITILPRAATLSASNDQVDSTAEEEMDPPPHKRLPVTRIAHAKGLKIPAMKEPTVIKIIRSINSPNSTPNPTPPPASKEGDLARRLQILYRIRHSSKKHCRRLGSGILLALAHLPMVPMA